MKIELPKGQFARILLGGWVLLLAGTLFVLLAGILFHRGFFLVTPLWILSIFVVIGTFVYAAASAVSLLSRYMIRMWRNGSNSSLTISPVEKVLLAAWLLFVGAALATLPFAQAKVGTEVRA